ncbi:MAG: hypothetical protein RLZZ502_910 [Pseudomonadota bacterium]
MFEEQKIKGACPHDCPDACAIVTTVVDGKAVDLRGAEDHPSTAGKLCNKVAHYLERTYHPERLRTPLKRINSKAEKPQWQAISWEEAYAEIATRFKHISQQHGAEAILPYSYAGHLGALHYASLGHRLFYALGASQLDRTICSAAGGEAIKLTIGNTVGTHMEQVVDSELVILWGTNSVTSNLHFWSRVQEAKRRGAYLISIDPYKNRSAEKCHEWLPIKPGTDAALAFALMHCLVRDGKTDEDYLNQYCLGSEEMKAMVGAWSPAKAAEITGLSVAQIESLAARYGATRKSFIRLNYGLQRHHGGGNAVRAISCLPAFSGAWRERSGGCLLSSSGWYPLQNALMQMPELMPTPKPRMVNMSQLGEALTTLTPPIKALYVYNANPAAVAPDNNQIIKGLKRDDLFTVVHDCFITDTAEFADLVLPATTFLEAEDIHRSYGHSSVLFNHAAIAPVGESRRNTRVFRELAQALGLTHPALYESDASLVRKAFDWQDPKLIDSSLAELKDKGFVHMQLPEAPFAQGGFPTESGKCEMYSTKAERMGLSPLPSYVAPLEASDALLCGQYPLSLNTPPAHDFMNSTFANMTRFTTPLAAPEVMVHPVDAATYGIEDGAWVQVHNARGKVKLKAKISDTTRQGVLTALSIWWRSLSPDGQNINALTPQHLTDIGRGATFYDCQVAITAA